MRFPSLAHAVAVAIVLAVASTASADPVKCTRAINKEVNKYIKQVQKNVDKCKNKTITKGENGGSLGNCTVQAIKGQPDDKIEKAASKMKAGIAKACGGSNKTCEVPPGDGDDALGDINWAIGACMNLEEGMGTDCDNPIDTCADVGDCLECIVDKGLEQAIDGLLYDQFNPAAFHPANANDPAKRYNKCQATIAKEGGKFLVAKQKILSKCWDAKLNGKTGFAGADPCPDTDPGTGSGNPPAAPGDNKTVEKIKKAEQKKVAQICKACGGGGDSNKDGVCDQVGADVGGGVTIALGDVVSLPFVCPSLVVPANDVHPLGLACFNPDVDTLQEYVECIDCVLEFKADCLTDAGVGDGNPGLGIAYPGECNPGVCGNDLVEAPEVCDGTDDAACPGQCSTLCTCPGTTTFTFDEDAGQSQAVLAPLGLAIALTGSVDLLIGEEVEPGVFPFQIAEGQLPGATIGALATVCPFLVNDPMFPAGIAGEGIINCTAADLTGSGLIESPDLSSFVDHCVQAGGCDSAPNGGGGLFSHCVGGANDGLPCGVGGVCPAPGTCTGGVFVPDQPSDGTCMPPNSADGYAPHAGVCNSPTVGPIEGATPYDFGDAVLTLAIALDIRGAGDPCNPPVTPGTAVALVTFTTGHAETGIMDADATAQKLITTAIDGAPFACPAVLNGTATGASLVGAFSAIDANLSILTLDTATSIRFTAD